MNALSGWLGTSRPAWQEQVQSLLSIPNIRSTEWKVSGDCDLTIKLGDEFPEKPPEVILTKGFTHPMANDQTGQVMVAELLPEEWKPKTMIGAVLKDLLEEFQKHPPQKTQNDENEDNKNSNKDESTENETIFQLKEWAELTENAKKKVEEELQAQQRLVKNLQNELEALKEKGCAIEDNEIHDTENLKEELKLLKNAHNQLEEQSKVKDEVIQSLRVKCSQLNHQIHHLEDAASKAAHSSTENQPLEDFNRQLREQVDDQKKQLDDQKKQMNDQKKQWDDQREQLDDRNKQLDDLKKQMNDLNKQLEDKKQFEAERAHEMKELAEINEKLETQNRSFSDRIKALEEEKEEMKKLEQENTKKILERDEHIALLEKPLQKEEEPPTQQEEENKCEDANSTTLKENTEESQDMQESSQSNSDLKNESIVADSNASVVTSTEQPQIQSEEQQPETEQVQDEEPKEDNEGFEVLNTSMASEIRIVKVGFLEKAGEHFYSQSQKRKFILHSDGSLCYERVNGKKVDVLKIDLKEAKSVSKFGNFELNVEMPKRKWSLKSTTMNDRDDWFDAMVSINGVKCDLCAHESHE